MLFRSMQKIHAEHAELEARARKIRRRLDSIGDSQPEAREQLDGALRQIEEHAHQLERKAHEFERQTAKEHLGDMQREVERLAKSGRGDEAEQVEETFRRQFHIDLVHVKAADRFLEALAGVVDPERKRRIIGEMFIRVFEEVARDLSDARFLVQGTLYPDVIESVPAHGGPTATIKRHHNVGGLPEKMDLKLIEPLRYLFKDEVREIGHHTVGNVDRRRRHADQGGNRLAESASCGDAVQLGLWLALEAGHIEFLDDVERWIRSRLLPAQVTQADRVELIGEIMRSEKVNEEAAEIQSRRIVGGWGTQGYPHSGKRCILDIAAEIGRAHV